MSSNYDTGSSWCAWSWTAQAPWIQSQMPLSHRHNPGAQMPAQSFFLPKNGFLGTGLKSGVRAGSVCILGTGWNQPSASF